MKTTRIFLVFIFIICGHSYADPYIIASDGSQLAYSPKLDMFVNNFLSNEKIKEIVRTADPEYPEYNYDDLVKILNKDVQEWAIYQSCLRAFLERSIDSMGWSVGVLPAAWLEQYRGSKIIGSFPRDKHSVDDTSLSNKLEACNKQILDLTQNIYEIAQQISSPSDKEKIVKSVTALQEAYDSTEDMVWNEKSVRGLLNNPNTFLEFVLRFDGLSERDQIVFANKGVNNKDVEACILELNKCVGPLIVGNQQEFIGCLDSLSGLYLERIVLLSEVMTRNLVGKASAKGKAAHACSSKGCGEGDSSIK